MPKIHVMPAHLADLIAAGEVVERPGSVVKELLENAVDAGAKTVSVELRAGGMGAIRVVDDGCGMSEADARTAFLRHATSKLTSEEQLEAIATLGFRGEALAAIAAVSRIELLTREADSPVGVRLTLEAGVVTGCEPVGCPVGTELVVRDLFFNTPARQKYMKRDSAEASNVFAMVQKQALANPGVSYRFVKEGMEQLHTPGDGDLKSAAYSVLGRDAALGLVPVTSAWNDLRVEGFVCVPTACRGSRSGQNFFVNGRPVKSQTMTAALEEAYKNQRMTGRYPACVLRLTLPRDRVDVNVHPAKTEVRFLAEKDVFDAIYYGVRDTLGKTQDRPELALDAPSLPKTPTAPTQQPVRAGHGTVQPKADFYRSMSAEEYRAAQTSAQRPERQTEQTGVYAVFSGSEEVNGSRPLQTSGFHYDLSGVRQGITLRPQADEVDTLTDEPEEVCAPAVPFSGPDAPEEAPPAPGPDVAEQTALPLPQTPLWRVVGEVLKTYIVVEEPEGMVLIDKHAAHERILFEAYRARREPITAQSLMVPLTFRPERQDWTALLEHPDTVREYGYELEDFGDGVLLVRQIPADLQPGEAPAALEALAATLLTQGHTDPTQLRDERLHTVACKAAIKAGYDTDPAQLEYLAAQVMTRDDLQHCPHGRPVCVRLSQKALEKQFKRIV